MQALHLSDNADDIGESQLTIIAACQKDGAGHIGRSGRIEGGGERAHQSPTLATASSVIEHLQIQLDGGFLGGDITSVEAKSASPLNPPDTISICNTLNWIPVAIIGDERLLYLRK